ncbi:YeeE/YedE family protein [Psychromonas sp. 14N.309.X.WAT.B.A12]|uniref:YeeE/YedE family protein n=1 Tax=unclassified Psychromonas TaxID=2614957 RepID=UPI0025AFB5DB|nr:YeeE/YedE family protein [Psychromonas sp. 14N.309.X.WAT.B.A12]MDN2663580.1 YeeE/YedE family protein [Psychromonas sp. 14N.309.X.WAT.B.A12]
MLKLLSASISGLLFGTGMIVSNMIDPAKVIGFLNITGQWDPSLAFVILGALVVFAPCYHLMIKKRTHALNGDKMNWSTNTAVDRKLVLGATLFGMGWGLVGLCPGPALTSIGSGSLYLLCFIISMSIGMLLVEKVFKKLTINVKNQIMGR